MHIILLLIYLLSFDRNLIDYKPTLYLHDPIAVVVMGGVRATVVVYDGRQGIEAPQADAAAIVQNSQEIVCVGVHHHAAESHPLLIVLVQIVLHENLQQVYLRQLICLSSVGKECI